MKNIILPKCDTFIKTYPKDANPLSILLNYTETYGWIMNSFIQITSYDDKYLDYYDFNYRNCPIIENQRIKKSLILDLYGDYTQFIIDNLNKGFYPTLLVNKKYISEYNSNLDITHDLFIYGYNGCDKVFYISDNFKNGKYSNGICTYMELENAIHNIQENKNDYLYEVFRDCIELLSYNKVKRTKLEMYRIKESIIDYLSSQPTKCWYVNHEMWDEDETKKRTFGIKCYNTIKNHILIASQLGYFIQGSSQVFYLMWEHKNTMLLRLKHLKENGIHFDDTTFILFDEIIKQAEICLRLKLKYDMAPDCNILSRITSIYNNIKDMEEETLEKIILKL